LFKCFEFRVIDICPFGLPLASDNDESYLGLLGGIMESTINKRRAISILAVFGAILYLVAAWNLGDNQAT
jgi:hypothetical protein